ncbi:PRTRC system ThiF family protein [Mucilaginibacter rubeus]|uniref:PRTRC system ThiF family protein n=1 Tax=Mucilaginibacter rubeus TaxID=2027860 RepID=A0AAE6JJ82_9SPHI|nr:MULTISPECIES: PRTRC system ThiF family protein [Mucilaginibacter]QEM06428.1 PRTRC system ThiF family protein [Mucilaginibacter rubeus]QEM19012.1 PRTRC system ThiF family protein [Mucilaginibacter gossypii]QTE44447.1 PRTRC system ThiF family protein [Mucilaginibacter rubeus]QTE51046.1 PRTRC system ThiF family protein [Mucilaginibacter rubeus]QTE56129.1 PRTRC system ThiF family protein [Mucilaginibacter rubeus]
MKTLPAIHFTAGSLVDPTNPITVNLIGAGGTGHRMLTELLRIHISLQAFGRPGLQVNVFDDDIISDANRGRQMFAQSEIGHFKSVILVNRINRSNGTNWKAVPERYSTNTLHLLPSLGKANIYITCVDTVSARFDIANALRKVCRNSRNDRAQPFYWMDCGNGRITGQVLLATLTEIKQPDSERFRTVAELPKVTDEFKHLLEEVDDNDEPSCSQAEALKKQDLFVNTGLAVNGAELLWQLLCEGMIEYRGVFINIKKFKTVPLKVA